MGEKFDREIALRIYKVLEEFVGASEQEREDFILAAADGITEYLFMGSLGFGGKFWSNMRRWYVNCYLEDETPARRTDMDAANIALARLRGSLSDSPSLPSSR